MSRDRCWCWQGPGSGKTRVVTHRVAHLIAVGVPAAAIVALTFTNKAADEMRRRVTELVGPQPVEMGTFHRFAARLLRRHARQVGLTSDYSIFDPDDAAAVPQAGRQETRAVALPHPDRPGGRSDLPGQERPAHPRLVRASLGPAGR